jgi:hypothetical protein
VTPKIGAFVIGDAGGGGSSPTWEIVYGEGTKYLKMRLRRSDTGVCPFIGKMEAILVWKPLNRVSFWGRQFAFASRHIEFGPFDLFP